MTRALSAAAALLVLALGAPACALGDGGAGRAVSGPYLNTSVGGTFRAEAARVR